MPIQRREAVVRPAYSGWEWDKFQPAQKRSRTKPVGYLYGLLEDTAYGGYLEVGGRRFNMIAKEAINGQGVECLDLQFDHKWLSGIPSSFPRTSESTFKGLLYYPENVAEVENSNQWTYSFYHNKRPALFGRKRVAYEIQKLKC